jgi:hypothetical protein
MTRVRPASGVIAVSVTAPPPPTTPAPSPTTTGAVGGQAAIATLSGAVSVALTATTCTGPERAAAGDAGMATAAATRAATAR